jgi:hypothetical protein
MTLPIQVVINLHNQKFYFRDSIHDYTIKRYFQRRVKRLFRRLRVFENRVLRRIFEPKRGEATGEWRRLRSEELNDLHSSPNIIRVIKSRRMRWAGYVARVGGKRGAYRILVERPDGSRPLERPRRRWENNIKMDLQDVGWGMD